MTFRNMKQLKSFSRSQGWHYFSWQAEHGRRNQKTPPYGGCVFVASEKHSDGTRYYDILRIMPLGNIKYVPSNRLFTNRKKAHAFAKAFAKKISQRT